MNSACMRLLKPDNYGVTSKADLFAGRTVEVVILATSVTVLVIALLGILARAGVVSQSLNLWAATPNCPCPYTWAAMGGAGILFSGLLIYKYWPMLDYNKLKLD